MICITRVQINCLGNGPAAVRVREDLSAAGPCEGAWRRPLLTVAGTGSVVEFDLVAGRLGCPGCSAPLVAWGYARRREVRTAAGGQWVRPRRSRCSGCRSTHVLLPVFCLLRRMYSAQVIMSALIAKAASGAGWRRVAAEVGVPGSTVRGWLRRFAGRAEVVRVFFTRAGVATGIDVAPPGPAGSLIGDALAAVGLLVTAARQRFAAVVAGVAVAGEASSWQVASAASGGRLLSPGWPGDTPGGASNTNRP